MVNHLSFLLLVALYSISPAVTQCYDEAISSDVLGEKLRRIAGNLKLEFKSEKNDVYTLYSNENYPFPTTVKPFENNGKYCLEIKNGRYKKGVQIKALVISELYRNSLEQEITGEIKDYRSVEAKNFFLSYFSVLASPPLGLYYNYNSPVFHPKAKYATTFVSSMVEVFFLSALYWGPRIDVEISVPITGLVLMRLISLSGARQGRKETKRWANSGYKVIPVTER